VATSETHSKDAATISEIQRLALPYSMEAQYPVADLSADRRVQVRDVSHYAPRENVEQYSAQMDAGVAFPSIVVTRDGWIVDGNTRIGARISRKDPFTPALVIDVDYGRAGEKQKGMLVALASTLNSQGGQRLTQKEVRRTATVLIALGWKSEQIARAIGLKPSSVTGVKQEIEAVARLEKVGVEAAGTRGPSLRALGSGVAQSLNDLPFKELAELACDAGFNATEIHAVAKSAKATGSDKGALDSLRALRVENNDRIAEKRLTGRGKPPVSRQLRQHIGFVNKFAGREDELVETDPKIGAQHVEALESAMKVLTEVLRMQVS
jgi:hypothetical protein